MGRPRAGEIEVFTREELGGILCDMLKFYRVAKSAGNEDEATGVYWGFYVLYLHANEVPDKKRALLTEEDVMPWVIDTIEETKWVQ